MLQKTRISDPVKDDEARAEPGGPGKSDARALRVSVIVTNYNYGHFLGPCLASLRAQTSAPDEIIVVDDGSTDGSRRLLDAEEGLTVILQDNAGQAAAFNAGFAASTGEAIIFLDADDILYPDAIAVIRALWTGREAMICWRLDTVDARGRKTGRYERWVPDLDMLPRLLDGLLLPFVPTSANVFARGAIAWAFPLPAERWRISADALVVRVAVLDGPMRPIAQVLGGYRIHGANNYHRGSEAQTSNMFRGLNDIADAGLDLVELMRRAGRLDRGVLVKLLTSALRVRLMAEDIAPEPARLRAFLRRIVALSREGGLRLALLARAADLLIPASPRFFRYLKEPGSRPRGPQKLIELIAGREIVNLRYAETPLRAPHDGPPASPGLLGSIYMPDLLPAAAWERNWHDGSFTLRADRGRFTLARPPGEAHNLRLTVEPGDASGVIVSVRCNDRVVACQYVGGPDNLLILLAVEAPGAWRPDRIEVAVKDTGRPRRLRDRWHRRPDRLVLREVVLTPSGPPGVDGVLPVLDERPLEALGSVIRAFDGSVLEGHSLIGAGERLSLALPVLPAPYLLSIRFSPTQSSGTFSLLAEGRPLFSGMIGPSQRIAVAIPPEMAASTRIELSPAFQPNDFLDGPEIAIDTLGWLPGPPESLHGLAALSPGETAAPGLTRTLAPFLGAGWDSDGNGAAHMTGSAAELHLALIHPGPAADLLFELEPLDPFAQENPPLLVVSAGAHELASVRLGGQGKVKVTVPPGPVELALHAMGAEGEAAEGADHGGIALHAISLAPAPDPVQAVHAEEPAPLGLAGLLATLETAASRGFAGDDPVALRDALAVEIAELAPAAAWHILGPDDLRRLAALGVRAGSGPELPPARGKKDRASWLRDFALAVLAGPDTAALRETSLASLPPLPDALRASVAEVLVRDPGPSVGRDGLRAYQDRLVARLDEARALLAFAPTESADWALGCEILRATHPDSLLFSDLGLKPHVTAFARALETRLLREGHVLGLPERRPSPSGGRPRIGILMRHLGPVPETWILKGVLRALPPSRADVTVFVTGAHDGPIEHLGAVRVVSLGGRSVSETVSSIRAAGLDTVVLGAAFHGYMPEAIFAAHRLAPRQITLAAAQYATTGFASVDEMIIGRLQAPKEAIADCSERVVLAPGTGQAFVFGAPPRAPAERGAMRRKLGVDDRTVILTSGAMADKIGPDVLRTWIRILAERSGTVLVLYPFAENWLRSYDQAGFADEARAACEAEAVDPGRVIVLPPLGAAGVADMLAAADVYLAAFPYSGATTTVEALKAGLPVVARAEPTQRGHQAASWLEAYGLDRLVAATDADYVRIAAGLCDSNESRQCLTREIRAAETAALAQEEFSAWLADHLAPPPSAPAKPFRYLYHHLPKTGGSSLNRVLSGWFDIVEDYPLPWGHFPLARVDAGALDPGQIIVGHYWAPEMPLLQRLPEVRDPKVWRLISLVRDPLDHALSEYFYEVRLRGEHDPGYEAGSLNDFLSADRGFYLSQFGATEDNWREVLDNYWFIGTLERFEDCVNYLADALGKPRPADLPVENVSPRTEEPDPDAVAAFKANNVIDYAIYEEVNRRLDRLLGS